MWGPTYIFVREHFVKSAILIADFALILIGLLNMQI